MHAILPYRQQNTIIGIWYNVYINIAESRGWVILRTLQEPSYSPNTDKREKPKLHNQINANPIMTLVFEHMVTWCNGYWIAMYLSILAATTCREDAVVMQKSTRIYMTQAVWLAEFSMVKLCRQLTIATTPARISVMTIEPMMMLLVVRNQRKRKRRNKTILFSITAITPQPITNMNQTSAVLVR